MHIFKRIFLFIAFISLIACDTSYDNSVSNNDNNKNTEQNQNTPEPSNPTENDDKPIVTDPEDNVTFVNKTDLIVKVYSDSLKTNLLTTVNTGETFSCNADINATGNVFYYTYYFVLKDVLDYIDIDTVLIPYGTGQNIVNLSPETMTTVNIVTPAKLGTNKNIIILENQSSSAIALTQANTELQPENKTSTLLNENEQGIYLLDLNNNLADYKVSDAGENISLREIDTADKGYIYYFTYNGKEAILNIKTLLQSSEEKNVIKLNANYLDVIKKFSAEEYKVIISGTMDDSTLSNIATAIKNNTFVKINLDLSCATELTTIGNSAFKDCSNLTSITIPDSVTSIGKEAFYSCYSLTSIIIPDSVTSIGDDAFENCYNLTSVTIPDSVTRIGERAFGSCDNLTSITIPDSVTSIGDYAFSYCDNLTSITIPGSVTSIGSYAFYNCSNLTSVIIPDSVTKIGYEAFYSCDNLTSVTIGNGVTTIGDSAFSSCSSLTSVTIGNNMTTIGNYAFSSCSSLTSVTIPDSVTAIGERAFGSCDNLTSVTFENTSTWYCCNYNGDIQVNVTNPTTNATNLKSTYCKYWWYKK